jgi:hypothetical protein
VERIRRFLGMRVNFDYNSGEHEDPTTPRPTTQFGVNSEADNLMSEQITSVHLLWFVDDKIEGNDGELLIGVYSSEEKAKAAIQRLSDKPGFGHPQGFQIHTYELNSDHWTGGYVIR